MLCRNRLSSLLWVESCPPKRCWNLNSQYLWIRPYFIIESLQMIKLRWGHLADCSPVWVCPYKREKFGHRHECNLQAKKKKKHMRLSEPWKEGCNRFYLDAPQEKPTLLIPWFQTFSLHDCETISFCCLSHPICGTCYGSPRKLNTFQRLGSNHSVKSFSYSYLWSFSYLLILLSSRPMIWIASHDYPTMILPLQKAILSSSSF